MHLLAARHPYSEDLEGNGVVSSFVGGARVDIGAGHISEG
jgi:hypothetical protein